jgi:predicted RNase H-like HicB family nuclease
MSASRRITLKVQIEREEDGRWIAEVLEMPGVQAYGDSQEDAVECIKELVTKVISDRLERGEDFPYSK